MNQDTLQTDDQPTPSLAGHVMGFVDTRDSCEAIQKKLIDGGIHAERIKVLDGPAGLEEFRRFFEGYTWGEESEQMLQICDVEFGNGHVCLCVDAAERDDGLQIANIAQALGGHGFRHFGTLTDERLTP
jgi:hypothetical protein